MSTITTKDGTQIYYKEWGEGPVVMFSHGWPLNADAWDGQMLFLAQNGYRVVAHDRRGHQEDSGPPIDPHSCDESSHHDQSSRDGDDTDDRVTQCEGGDVHDDPAP